MFVNCCWSIIQNDLFWSIMALRSELPETEAKKKKKNIRIQNSCSFHSGFPFLTSFQVENPTTVMSPLKVLSFLAACSSCLFDPDSLACASGAVQKPYKQCHPCTAVSHRPNNSCPHNTASFYNAYCSFTACSCQDICV